MTTSSNLAHELEQARLQGFKPAYMPTARPVLRLVRPSRRSRLSAAFVERQPVQPLTSEERAPLLPQRWRRAVAVESLEYQPRSSILPLVLCLTLTMLGYCGLTGGIEKLDVASVQIDLAQEVADSVLQLTVRHAVTAVSGAPEAVPLIRT